MENPYLTEEKPVTNFKPFDVIISKAEAATLGDNVTPSQVKDIIKNKNPYMTSSVNPYMGIQNAQPQKGFWDNVASFSSAESDMMSSPSNLEITRNILGGGTAWIPAGIIKLAGIISGQRQGGEDLANVVQQKITGTPQTEEGKLASQIISKPFEKLSEYSQNAADWVYNQTENPYLATATRVAGESIPFVAPYLAGKGIKVIKENVTPKENITPKEIPAEQVKTKETPIEKPISPTEKVEPAQTSQVENVVKPVLEGKPAKSAVDVNAVISKKGFESLPDEELAKYSPIKKSEVLNNINTLLSSDETNAFEMAKGNKEIPDGIQPQVLFNTVEKLAEQRGDVQTLVDLAKSPLATERSLSAQNLGASAWNKIKDSVVEKISEVKRNRESKIKDTKLKEQVKQGLVEEVKKINLSKEELSWDRFLSKIEC
jgi:hypothetical protein